MDRVLLELVIKQVVVILHPQVVEGGFVGDVDLDHYVRPRAGCTLFQNRQARALFDLDHKVKDCVAVDFSISLEDGDCVAVAFNSASSQGQGRHK